jgi:hypothetical protein
MALRVFHDAAAALLIRERVFHDSDLLAVTAVVTRHLRHVRS